MRGGGRGSGYFAFGDARRAPCDRGLLSGAYAPVGREGWRVGREGGSWGADARIRVRPNEVICRNGRTEETRPLWARCVWAPTAESTDDDVGVE